jgi:hypothetical protein
MARPFGDYCTCENAAMLSQAHFYQNCKGELMESVSHTCMNCGRPIYRLVQEVGPEGEVLRTYAVGPEMEVSNGNGT